MSKNLKTLICCVLVLMFASVTFIAVFADSSVNFTTEEAESVSAEDMTDTETVIKLGDVNFDGRVKAGDARLALRFSAELDTPSAEEFVAADVNEDGKVKAGDARLILRVSAGLDDESVFGAADSDAE